MISALELSDLSAALGAALNSCAAMIELNAKEDQRSRYGRLMFVSDYSRAEKLVNGSTENFSKNHGEIPGSIDISSWMPTSVLRKCFRKRADPSFRRRPESIFVFSGTNLDSVFTRMTNKNQCTSGRRNRNPSASSQGMFS